MGKELLLLLSVFPPLIRLALIFSVAQNFCSLPFVSLLAALNCGDYRAKAPFGGGLLQRWGRWDVHLQIKLMLLDQKSCGDFNRICV